MKIPHNLKPGDRLWYSKTECVTVGWDRGQDPVLYEEAFTEGKIRLWTTQGDSSWAAYTMDGTEVDGDTPPIIRVERVTSAKPKKAKAKAKAKVDKDAAWLLKYFGETPPWGWGIRLRSIANRLNGGAK